tara:strand:- start:9433 stop:11208 length:1776 start_codon:yes stop_codon:yes gene_type:complete
MKEFLYKFQFFSIFRYVKRKRRIQLVGLFLLMILSALTEIITLTAVIPFINIISNTDKLVQNNIFEKIVLFLINNDKEYFVMATTLIFCLIIIITSCVRIICIWFSGYFAAHLGSDLSCNAYYKSLLTPYKDHLNRNSSYIVNTIANETSRAVTAINGYLQIFTGIIVSISITFIMLFITKNATIIAAISFITSYLILAKISKKTLLKNSKNITSKSTKLVKFVNEGLGAIRDIILENKYVIYVDDFQKASISMRLSQANNKFFSTFPRYALEGVGLLTIAVIAYYLVIIGDGKNIIGILGVIALGSQRLLPSFQGVYNGWASINSFSSSLDKLMGLVKTKNLIKIKTYGTPDINFENKIQLKNISFSYSSRKVNVIEGLNLTICKGDRIGILGETGSGKSTFLDIFTGLLKPSSGSFYVDNTNLMESSDSLNINAWQQLISHVPQSSYLLDASFKSNIAFGIKDAEIDIDKVKLAAKIAKIDSFIESTKYSYETYVGERGILISGGQRQRIALARALYNKKKILVLDEATSALDNETEKILMNNIYKTNKEITIIIIAHRLNTLYNCDKLYVMKNKRLEEISLEDLKLNK